MPELTGNFYKAIEEGGKFTSQKGQQVYEQANEGLKQVKGNIDSQYNKNCP